jgi:hypothetical protein
VVIFPAKVQADVPVEKQASQTGGKRVEGHSMASFCRNISWSRVLQERFTFACDCEAEIENLLVSPQLFSFARVRDDKYLVQVRVKFC